MTDEDFKRVSMDPEVADAITVLLRAINKDCHPINVGVEVLVSLGVSLMFRPFEQDGTEGFDSVGVRLNFLSEIFGAACTKMLTVFKEEYPQFYSPPKMPDAPAETKVYEA